MRTSQRSVASAVSRTCTDGVDGRQAEPALDVSRETSDRYPCSPRGVGGGSRRKRRLRRTCPPAGFLTATRRVLELPRFHVKHRTHETAARSSVWSWDGVDLLDWQHLAFPG